MKGIVTVVGKDRVGIIAAVCGFLSERSMNILDISQTITHGYFNMLMVIEWKEQEKFQFSVVAQELHALGDTLGLQIKLQREEIFEAMHRI